jgi:hypothetical protein
MDDCLGVSLCPEYMAAAEQVLAKLLVVVNFAVENNVDAAVLIRQWLVTAAEVNNGEAAKAKANRTVDEISVVVWAAMADCVRHALDESRRNTSPMIKEKFSADSAHLGFASKG